jgi:hypothetical protein
LRSSRLQQKVTGLPSSLTTFKTVEKGEIMKKQHSAALFTLICLFGLSVSARAEDEHKIVVNVPYDFVAGGKTLSAGKYSVSRVSPEADSGLSIRGEKEGVYVIAIFDDDTAMEHAGLSFEHVGGKYFLSTVQTLSGTYTIAVPQEVTKVAKMKGHETESSAGTD